ncbi:hypothetical protein B0H16DRAFT_739779 [Mycena metata]|uniref:Uncharacterized protein n=1 Tax=Mycena metata TaxID=1033252 RepID=A0AAD7E043_9AGAR|nr:hypothetical protein B0H16DRAFT_739779 [Mycena metata]
MLGDTYSSVRSAAVKALILLPSSGSIGAATTVFGTYANIVLSLQDGDGYIARIQSKALLQTIGTPIENSEEDLRQVMLEVINYFAEFDTVGAAIAVCEMVASIISSTVLEKDGDRKQEKVAAMVSIAHDPTIGTVTNLELWGDFFATLGDGDEMTRETANRTVVSLAQHEVICAAIATLQIVVKLYDKDEVTVRASIEALCSSSDDIIGPSILTVDLITQLLPGLSNQNESLRWQAMNSIKGSGKCPVQGSDSRVAFNNRERP